MWTDTSSPLLLGIGASGGGGGGSSSDGERQRAGSAFHASLRALQWSALPSPLLPPATAARVLGDLTHQMRCAAEAAAAMAGGGGGGRASGEFFFVIQ